MQIYISNLFLVLTAIFFNSAFLETKNLIRTLIFWPLLFQIWIIKLLMLSPYVYMYKI